MYKFINTRMIDDLNDFLSKGALSDRARRLIDTDIDGIKHPSDEMLFWKLISKFPPIIRPSVGDLRKYMDSDACIVTNFKLGKFNINNLNDPHETRWFSSFLDGIGSSTYRNAVSSLIARRDIFVTYTTRSTHNEHYMYSNYSVNKRNHLRYNYSDVLREFEAIPEAMNISGYVRYGQNKVDVKVLAKELWDSYGSRPGIKFAMAIMCFFVKSVCAKPEQEYRFMSISNKDKKSSKVDIDLNVIPSQWELIGRDRFEFIHNRFYLNKNRIQKTECGCDSDKWDELWRSRRKICRINNG